MNEIKKQALEHYDRMIDWAEKIDDKKDFDSSEIENEMENDLGENWFGAYCAFCGSVRKDDFVFCKKCMLYINGDCCGGLWIKISKAESKSEFISALKAVRKFIEERG